MGTPNAPSTTLRVIPLPSFAVEDLRGVDVRPSRQRLS
jgi:hypothetical protein